MTLYKKKPLPKRKIKKGQAGVIAIPAAGAVAGEVASGAGSLPSAIVVGAIADYNRRKNGDWFLDLVYTSPTGVAWQRPIPSKPVVEVVEEAPVELVREEVHRPFRIEPVIGIGVQAPGLDLDYNISDIERVLDYSRAKAKSFYNEYSSDESENGPKSSDTNGGPKGTRGTGDPKWYQKLWSWTKKQYDKGKDLWDKGKDLWDKGKSFNHGPIYRIPLIINLGYDFRNWNKNTPLLEKAWDVVRDSTPIITLGYLLKNLVNSKLFDKVSYTYDLTFGDNTKSDDKSNNDNNQNNNGELNQEKNETVEVHMNDTIDTKLDGIKLLQNTDTI